MPQDVSDSFLRELTTMFRVENVRFRCPVAPDTRRNLAKLRLVSGGRPDIGQTIPDIFLSVRHKKATITKDKMGLNLSSRV